MNLFLFSNMNFQLFKKSTSHKYRTTVRTMVRYGTWRRKTAHGDGERILR